MKLSKPPQLLLNKVHNLLKVKIDTHSRLKRAQIKLKLKKAIEAIFNVKVLSVNTVNVLPKFKRMGKYEGYKPAYKKAVVKIAEGQKNRCLHVISEILEEV